MNRVGPILTLRGVKDFKGTEMRHCSFSLCTQEGGDLKEVSTQETTVSNMDKTVAGDDH